MAEPESPPELTVEFDSVEALKKEFDSNLRKGRTFAPGATGLDERAVCKVVLVHPETGSAHTVRAEAVWVKRDEPGIGVGVQFLDFDDAARATIEAFVSGGVAVLHSLAPTSEPPAAEIEIVNAPQSNPAPQSEPNATVAADDGAENATEERRGRARNIHERVRAMNIREQQSTARQGTLTERVALERAYGSSLWEFLLQNPNLTVPEVARISKKGSLPKPLVNIIVANGAWVGSPEVQRALLSNPRVTGGHLDRVLRASSQADLQRISQQTAYRSQVRGAAKKLIRK